jgi:chaperonin GroEL (HSP60 family)
MSANTNDEFKPQTSSILRPGTIYYFENKALISNIQAALSVVNIIKSTYGPKGRDKLIYRDGKLTVTNGTHVYLALYLIQFLKLIIDFLDGATILKLLKIDHPAAQILVNTSLAQDREVI